MLRRLLVNDRVLPADRIWRFISPRNVRQLIVLISDAKFRQHYSQLQLGSPAPSTVPFSAAVAVLLREDEAAQLDDSYEAARSLFDRDSDTPVDRVFSFYGVDES